MNDARTPAFLMANLGAEMKRALRFYEKKMLTQYEGSRDRVSGIIEEFLVLEKSEGGKAEARLLGELVSHLDEGRQAFTQEMLDRYFAPFASRAMTT